MIHGSFKLVILSLWLEMTYLLMILNKIPIGICVNLASSRQSVWSVLILKVSHHARHGGHLALCLTDRSILV